MPFSEDLGEKALDELVNEYEAAKVSAMDPRKLERGLYLLHESASTEEILHHYRVRESDFATVVKTLSCSSDCGDQAVCVRTRTIMYVRHGCVFLVRFI